jgi:hypothetical protein
LLAFEFSHVLLKTEDLGQESVALVDELINAFTEDLVDDQDAGWIGRIDQPGVALALSSAVRSHPLRVRRPLAGPARSSLTAHDTDDAKGTSRITTRVTTRISSRVTSGFVHSPVTPGR